MSKAMVRAASTSTAMAAVTKTLLGGKACVLPGDARTLKQIHMAHAASAIATIQSLTIKYEIESSDLRSVTPFEVLGAPTGAGLATAVSIPTSMTGKEFYDVETLCRGSDQVSVYGTSLVDATTEPEVMAWLLVDTEQPQMQQRHAKMGTITAIGAGATVVDTDVAGTKYTFSGGSKIIELFGSIHYKTVAAGDGLLGGIKFTSSEFVSSLPQELPLYPWTSGTGSTCIVAHIPGVSRLKGVDVPLKPGQVSIQDYFNGGVLPAGSDSMFIDGVVYV